MENLLRQLDHSRILTNDLAITTILSYAFAALVLVHQILYQYDLASHSLLDIVWAAIVHVTPDRLLLEPDQLQELDSQRYSAKADALRNMLGVGRQTLMQQVPGAAGIARRLSMVKSGTSKSDAPAGLGNWDNSCYQNSVLQGLTSLTFLDIYLSKWSSSAKLSPQSTLHALQETTTKLRDPLNNGKHIWTPAKLKSMSSWQQQDAQEYFSKVMDELDKDMSKAGGPRTLDGLETAGQDKKVSTFELQESQHNPLEGLLSQQVACTACGFSEGLSMIPFNCLTVPLGERTSYDLAECLDEYTKLEPITDVECTKCTLLKAKQDLRRMSASDAQAQSVIQLPPEVREQVMRRLHEVEQALDNDDFSDETLIQKCQISKKARVSSTKTRQALIGRAPQDLVVHINRSVFDEMTGMQRKNYAGVRYPAVLDLGRWTLGSQLHSSPGLPREDMWKYVYRLKAIVTHYGRHENGHYIAYRQAPKRSEDGKPQWWQLSDEDVSACSEGSALEQGGVFMLFYERAIDLERTSKPTQAETGTISKVEHTAEAVETAMSEASTIEDDADFEELPPVRTVPQASPILMRTANVATNDDHWNLGRFVAAS